MWNGGWLKPHPGIYVLWSCLPRLPDGQRSGRWGGALHQAGWDSPRHCPKSDRDIHLTQQHSRQCEELVLCKVFTVTVVTWNSLRAWKKMTFIYSMTLCFDRCSEILGRDNELRGLGENAACRMHLWLCQSSFWPFHNWLEMSNAVWDFKSSWAWYMARADDRTYAVPSEQAAMKSEGELKWCLKRSNSDWGKNH